MTTKNLPSQILELAESRFDKNNPLFDEYISICSEEVDEENAFYDRHHILPKSIYPEYEKCEWNLVSLDYIAHYKAHEILPFICLREQDSLKMIRAWNIMCHIGENRDRVDAQTYAKLKELFLISFSGENNPMYGKRGELSPHYGKRGEGITMYGKQHSEEAKRKMSLSRSGEKNPNFGKPMSEEQKLLISIANTGRNPSEETRAKMSESRKNRPPATEETKKKMSEAKKGKQFTEDHKKNLSESRTGYKVPKDVVDKITNIIQKYKYNQFSDTGEFVKTWDTKQEIVEAGYNYASILKACSGEYKHHKNFRWSRELRHI